MHEPHSFSVVVTAREGSTNHRWTFDSFEGRTTIAAKTAEEAGIRTEIAGPAAIVGLGAVSPAGSYPTRSACAASRRGFRDSIREVKRSVGDTVRAGDVLATVESNESLETYSVSAPIAGVIVERHANPGENATSEPLFVIADYTLAVGRARAVPARSRIA